MKAGAVIMLLAIAFGVFSPPAVNLTIAHGQTSIGTVDVCHAGSPALSASNDMPCVSQSIYGLYIPPSIEGAQILDPTLKLIFSTSQEEHPPKS